MSWIQNVEGIISRIFSTLFSQTASDSICFVEKKFSLSTNHSIRGTSQLKVVPTYKVTLSRATEFFFPVIAFISETQISIVNPPVDVEILTLSPPLNILFFRLAHSTINFFLLICCRRYSCGTFGLRLTRNDITSRKSTTRGVGLKAPSPSSSSWSPTTSASTAAKVTPTLTLGALNVCAINFPLTSANVCSSPSIKDQNLSSQYIRKYIRESTILNKTRWLNTLLSRFFSIFSCDHYVVSRKSTEEIDKC